MVEAVAPPPLPFSEITELPGMGVAMGNYEANAPSDVELEREILVEQPPGD